MTHSEKSREARLQAYLRRAFPLCEYMGVTIEELGENVRCSVPLCPANSTHVGTLHPAAMFTIGEMAAGLACQRSEVLRDSRYIMVAKDVRLTFLKPAKTEVEARARVSDAELEVFERELLENGKGDINVSVGLFDPEGREIVRVETIFHGSANPSRWQENRQTSEREGV